MALLTAGAALAALGVAGCAPSVDPSATRDSLTEVTEDPTPPEAAERYDAARHPEPVVEPRDCSPYLVITVRGTGEPTKGQLLSPVARSISEARPGETEILDLEYPADTDVNEGGTVGARTLLDTLNVQTEACPEQRFVLLGYSQGALVIGDVLAAPADRLVGGTVGELRPEAAERVRAVVLYGDPRFVGGEPFNVGDSDPAVSGLLPRPAGALDAFADRLRDYCVARDFICQSSLDLDESGHVAYFENGMQQDGAAFAITRLDPPAAVAPEEGAPGEDAPQPGPEAPEAPPE